MMGMMMMVVLLIITMACSTFPVLVLFYSVYVFILHPATMYYVHTLYGGYQAELRSISPSPTPTYPLGKWGGSRPKLHFCSQLPTGKSTAAEKR